MPLTNAHSALADAEATAGLLQLYLGTPDASLQVHHRKLRSTARRVLWPARPDHAPLLVQHLQAADRAHMAYRKQLAEQQSVPLLRLLDSVSISQALAKGGAPADALGYVELLASACEDGQIDAQEEASLEAMAAVYDLTPAQREAAHRGLLGALAQLAASDSRIDVTEGEEIRQVAALLRLPERQVGVALTRARQDRLAHLSKICRNCLNSGLMGSRCGSVTGSRSPAATRPSGPSSGPGGGPRVHHHRQCLEVHPPTRRRWLIHRAQSHRRRRAAYPDSAPRPVRPSPGPPAALHPANTSTRRKTTESTLPTLPGRPAVEPAHVRAWAAATGRPVAARGRLAHDLVDAYLKAHPEVLTAAAP